MNVGELSAVLDLNDKPYNDKMDNADKKTGKLGEAGSKAGLAIASGMVLAGTAAAGFGYKATMAASDLGENISKTDNVFKQNAATIHKWAEGAADDFGQSRRQAEEAAGTFGNLFVQLGIGGEKAADMSMQMTELASDFASFHNADITEVIEAQTAAFRGEYDSLQRFVPTINAAAVEQKALEMTHKATTKELTAQEKALATQTLMMQGAGDAMGDFDRTSDSLANRMRKADASVEDFTSRVGSKLLPVVLDAWDAFDKVSPVIGEKFSDATGKAADVAGPLGERIVHLTDVAGKLSGISNGQYGFGEAFEYGSKSAGQLEEDMNGVERAASMLGGAFSVFGETGGEIWTDISDLAGNFFETFDVWTTDNEARLQGWQDKAGETLGGIAQAFALAFELIGVVVGIFTGAVSEVWDRFGTHLLDHMATALDAILQVLSGVLSVIQGVLNIFIGIFTGDWERAWQGVLQVFGGIWDIILGIGKFAINQISTIIGLGMAVISAIWSGAWGFAKDAASAAWHGIVALVEWHIGNVVGIIKGLGGLVSGAASGAFEGIKEGFRAAINWILARWNGLSFTLPEMDTGLPGIGKIGGKRFDTPDVPLLADGGRIVGAGLAIVGEAGPELVSMGPGASVIPLPRNTPESEATPTVIIETIEINGIRDGADVVDILPQLQQAIAAGVGRNR